MNILIPGLILAILSTGFLETADAKSADPNPRSSKSVRKGDPVFFVKIPGQALEFRRQDLLKRKDVERFTVEKDPAYKGAQVLYTAVPAAHLFESLKFAKDDTLYFHCLDGFSGPISMDKVLNTDPGRAIAYLAIESPAEKWPVLSSQEGAQTAGPFYLIWKNPKSSQVGTEEWPYQLTGFEIKKSIQTLYPAIFPDSSLAKDHPVQKGFQVFLKNCFACHTFNHQGESSLGPDLNLPMNPTEYFTEKALLQFLRNPESVRSWPGQKMKGLSKEEVTDADLKNLVEYFKHMASTRTAR